MTLVGLWGLLSLLSPPPFSPPSTSISCPGPAGNKWNGCVTWFLAWLGQRGSLSVKLCPTLGLCCLLVAMIQKYNFIAPCLVIKDSATSSALTLQLSPPSSPPLLSPSTRLPSLSFSSPILLLLLHLPIFSLLPPSPSHPPSSSS